MLYLTFHIDDEVYGIPSRDIVELLPLLHLRNIPQAPEYVAGMLNYHGAMVPVIDIRMLMVNCPCDENTSTRIIITETEMRDKQNHLVALVVEDASETIMVADNEICEPVVDVPEMPYLGRFFTGEDKYVQLIDVAQLLPEHVRKILYPEVPGVDHANG